MSRCEGCAEAWQAAWEVRSMLGSAEESDPGEAYFVQATAGIMSQVSVIAASETPSKTTEDVSVVGSLRYGPLQIRGVGVALLITATLLIEGLFSPAAPSRAGLVPDLGGLRLTPASDCVDLPAAPFAARAHAAYAGHPAHAAFAAKQPAPRIPPASQPNPSQAARMQAYDSPPPQPLAA